MSKPVSPSQERSLIELATTVRRRTRDLDVIELCDRVLGLPATPRSEALALSVACAAPAARVTMSRNAVTKLPADVTKLGGKAGRRPKGARAMTAAERKRISRAGAGKRAG